ncbi:hypothetical protein IWQ60_006809 [Tieghemiomyces parasiticus]|uniref:Uncharacterized protein n=1 Tax=Tieghemiomyces parasiticus TaxID=78921 RepID=A0A9W8A6A9_9FUNG|nr:hypothetical protein IWQ60_006809 [Tieghemiomyces parasiticus]
MSDSANSRLEPVDAYKLLENPTLFTDACAVLSTYRHITVDTDVADRNLSNLVNKVLWRSTLLSYCQ